MSRILTKICKKCGTEKNAACFGIRKFKCKDCVNEYKKGRYERRKNKFAALSEEEKYPGHNRICSTCKIEKAAEMFNQTCVGYQASCKECGSKKSKEYRWRGRIDTRHLPKSEVKIKVCTECKTEKLFEFFHKSLRGKFGLASKCKDCRGNAAKRVKIIKRLEREEAKRLIPVVIETHKICPNCQENKEIEMFPLDKRSLKYGRKCKECIKKGRANKKEALKVKAEALFKAQQENHAPIKCKKCGVEKDVSLFDYNYKKLYPNCYGKCKECSEKYKIARHERKMELFLLKQGLQSPHPASKICSKCNLERDISLFLGHKLGSPYYRSDCKICRSEAWQIYRLENREKILAKSRSYHSKNQEKINEKNRQFRIKNKERLSIKNREYRIKGRARIAAWHRNRRKTNLEFKILCNLRNRAYCALKGFSKSAKTLELLGCSVEFLRKHLESQFEPKMSWDNYGLNGWSVDHIAACATFDLSKEEEQKKCFHYSNLAPRWTTTGIAQSYGSNQIGNVEKGNKIIGVDISEQLL